MSRLLIDDQPLQVLPKLAVVIGLNEAVVLQQLHYWINRSKHFHDERYWVYNTLAQWQEQFPFWSTKTLQRTFTSLEKQGLLLTGQYGPHSFDRTKWYAIDYARLDALELSTVRTNRPPPFGQIVQIDEDKLSPSPYTETTTETTDREQQQDAELLLFIADVAQGLEDEGIAPKTALELAWLDPDLAADWLEAKREWHSARDPAGLLVAKIRAGEQAPRPRRLRRLR